MPQKEDFQRYADMLHLPHPTSATHPRMAASERAAQFSPFAALSGYDAAVKESARITEAQMDLSEDIQAVLDQKQTLLLHHLQTHPRIAVTFFVEDHRKSGGAYQTLHGCLKGIDTAQRLLLLQEGDKIPLDDVVDLQSPLFDGLFE